MALRTVTLSPDTSRRLSLTPAEWRRRIDQTLADANAAVAAASPEALRAAFAGVDAWEEQRAYQARRQLAELVFVNSARLPQIAWTTLYLAAAESLLATLERTPAEPVLLNYAGVFLYEVGELGGAEALFRAAAKLDPELEHVERNLREVRRRKRSATPALKGPLAAQARGAGALARRIAAAARPARDQTLSLVMIVKDEEEMLPGCLAAVQNAVDEMVVVDTGSTDRTVAIAESFGAKVVHFPWNGSFADARNVSLDNATGDWVVYLDADEHLVPEDALRLRGLLGRTWREAFYLVETNYTGGEEAGSSVTHLALRLFRNRPEYRFEGRIHEQKTHTMPTYLPERFETTDIRMLHYGYLKSRIGSKEKSRRNIELLEQDARENPGPFVDFNLGSEYIALGEYDRARTHLDRAWDELRTEPGWAGKGFVPMLAARAAQARREAGDPVAARALVDDALVSYPEHTELVLIAAMCARDQADLVEAAQLAERCLALGDAPAKYGATVGSGTYLARCLLADVQTAQGLRAEAEQQFLLALEEHPDYIAPILPLTALRVARDAEPADVCVRLAEERPTAALLLGTALYEGGRAAEAEQQFASVLERSPSNGAARIGLVETLLSQRRYAEAARAAAEEPATSPVSATAARAELFAHAVERNLPALEATLVHAGERGVPHADVELYRAWAAALAGRDLPPTLPGAAAPTAFTALEALLRVVDVEAFAVLHSLAERIAVDPRERREALGRMYLRRGFLDSAAEEWLAVARERPDARAYLGLAQVAVARDLREDAATLAREARALEPGNVAATRLCDALGV